MRRSKLRCCKPQLPPAPKVEGDALRLRRIPLLCAYGAFRRRKAMRRRRKATQSEALHGFAPEVRMHLRCNAEQRKNLGCTQGATFEMLCFVRKRVDRFIVKLLYKVLFWFKGVCVDTTPLHLWCDVVIRAFLCKKLKSRTEIMHLQLLLPHT